MILLSKPAEVQARAGGVLLESSNQPGDGCGTEAPPVVNTWEDQDLEHIANIAYARGKRIVFDPAREAIVV